MAAVTKGKKLPTGIRKKNTGGTQSLQEKVRSLARIQHREMLTKWVTASLNSFFGIDPTR